MSKKKFPKKSFKIDINFSLFTFIKKNEFFYIISANFLCRNFQTNTIVLTILTGCITICLLKRNILIKNLA